MCHYLPADNKLDMVTIVFFVFGFTTRKWSLRRSCFHMCLSVHGGGVSVSVQGGLCPLLGRGSLSMGASVWGGLCGRSLSAGDPCLVGLCLEGLFPGGLCPGGPLPRGSLSRGVSVQEGSLSQRFPCTVMNGQYTSYWNAFLLFLFFALSFLTCCCSQDRI